jgi:hypothetical protein
MSPFKAEPGTRCSVGSTDSGIVLFSQRGSKVWSRWVFWRALVRVEKGLGNRNSSESGDSGGSSGTFSTM